MTRRILRRCWWKDMSNITEAKLMVKLVSQPSSSSEGAITSTPAASSFLSGSNLLQ